MSNKSVGRALANMDSIQYLSLMGGQVSNAKNTGIDFTNYAVWKYFKMLSAYALNRVRWTSDSLSPEELRLIEWNIFFYGMCAMVRPRITRNGFSFQSPKPRIYRCVFTEHNLRSGQPFRINIVNAQNSKVIVDTSYCQDDFVIFSDEFLWAQHNNPFSNVAWEFANKLYELDLVFNANSHRNRMPFIFNNAAMSKTKDGRDVEVARPGLSLAEIIRSAFGRNEQFAEVSETMVGRDGFMFEPQYVENQTLELIDAQKKLYQAYFELLGLYTNKEKTGVYTVKRLQEDGDETPDYITECMKGSRVLSLRQAVEKFHISLELEIL